jgi:serine protein kinase
MSIFNHFRDRYETTQEEEYTLQEYLELCKKDRSVYASAAERLLLAIGEPETIDTSRDLRLSRIFQNKIIRRYKAFDEFYGGHRTDRFVFPPRRAGPRGEKTDPVSARSGRRR